MVRQIDLDQVQKVRVKSRRKKLLVALVIFSLLTAGAVLALSNLGFLQTLLTPVSFVARLVNPVELKEVDGRVNVLVLGVDTRNSGWSGLTDTILVGSISPLEGNPALVSIPRDFWVKIPPYGQGKINTAYNYGGGASTGNGREFDVQKGVEFSKAKIEEVLGIKIPYWVVVNFEGFKEIIDTLGGIEVCVERAFDDYSYPIPGREKARPLSSRYEHLHFDAGCQMMSGETALKYARSRMGTNGEGSDFARTRRQQKVIMAVKGKVLSLNLLFNPGKLNQLYKQLTAAVKTNASFGEVQRALELANRLGDISQVKDLVLDPDSGLVFHPNNSLFGGAYVLVPKGGDTYYTKIHQAVRTLLFGAEKETAPASGAKP